MEENQTWIYWFQDKSCMCFPIDSSDIFNFSILGQVKREPNVRENQKPGEKNV